MEDEAGTNYLDSDTKLLHVLMKGSTRNTPIRIHIKQSVVLTFGLPMISVDDFYGEYIVENLASFLSISEENIFIVNPVSESLKKKRDTTY